MAKSLAHCCRVMQVGKVPIRCLDNLFGCLIAFGLSLSEVTVKMHRNDAMCKLAATSIGDLVRIWGGVACSKAHGGGTLFVGIRRWSYGQCSIM